MSTRWWTRRWRAIGTPEAKALLGKIAIANSKLVYRRFLEIFHGEGFAALRQRGARVQRPLWASTGTKNPAYSDVLYVENLIGPETVNTLPPETLNAFRDHGKVPGPTVKENLDEAEAALGRLHRLGIDLNAITEKLQQDGVSAFAASFDQLMAALEKKRQRDGRRGARPPGAASGKISAPGRAAAERLARERSSPGGCGKRTTRSGRASRSRS